MKHRLPLNALYTLSVLGEHKQITKTADVLCKTQSAVSQQLRFLDDYFGFKLYHKVGRDVVLTSNAKDYAIVLNRLFSDMQNATDKLTKQQNQENTITVNLYTTFATRWLIPKMSNFVKSNPCSELRISTPTKQVDFDLDDIDAAIYLGNDEWKNLETVFLFRDDLVVVAKKGTKINVSSNQRGKKIIKNTLLHVNAGGRDKDWSTWLQSAGFQSLSKHKVAKYETMDQAIHAALSGLGIAIVHRSFVEKELSSGGLKLAHNHITSAPTAYYLVFPSKNKQRIKQLKKWLLTEVKESMNLHI